MGRTDLMSDDARSLIRSAQTAELDGDIVQARFLLEQAANAFESAGNLGRAEQLRRHRGRLEERVSKSQERTSRSSGPDVRLESQAAAFELSRRLSDKSEFRVLLMGPSGSGKTFWLREWASAGKGTYVLAGEWARKSLPEGMLLIDDLDSLEMSEALDLLTRAGEQSFIFAARGTLPPPQISLQRGTAQVGVYGTDELARTAGQRIPLKLLESVTSVERFDPISTEDLFKLASAWVQSRNLPLEEPTLRQLAAHAGSSPRNGHELYALLGRAYEGAPRSNSNLAGEP